MQPYLGDVIDPGQELSHVGINPGVVGFSAAPSPADDAHQAPRQLVLADQGAPAVTLQQSRDVSTAQSAPWPPRCAPAAAPRHLAGIDLALRVPGAQHPGRELSCVHARAVAPLGADQGHQGFLQHLGELCWGGREKPRGERDGREQEGLEEEGDGVALRDLWGNKRREQQWQKHRKGWQGGAGTRLTLVRPGVAPA